MAQRIRDAQKRPQGLAVAQAQQKCLLIQWKLRDPIKTLIGISEVNICCFLVTFARLGISFVSFPESVAPTSATAKQLSTLSLTLTFPTLLLCLSASAHSATCSPSLCVCQESHQIEGCSGAICLECLWALYSLPHYCVHCPGACQWCAYGWPPVSGPGRGLLPLLLVSKWAWPILTVPSLGKL